MLFVLLFRIKFTGIL